MNPARVVAMNSVRGTGEMVHLNNVHPGETRSEWMHRVRESR